MTTPRDPLYVGYRHPTEIISYVVWLYFRFPLSLRMVEEMLAVRGIAITYETIRQWSLKFGDKKQAPCPSYVCACRREKAVYKGRTARN